jgi:hypothetical protein
VSLTLEFVTGDDAALEPLLRRAAWDEVGDSGAVRAEADFSLQLRPRDLDALSTAMAHFNGEPPRDLRSAMTVLEDEPDHGVLAVQPGWVRYAAAVPASAAHGLAGAWFAGLGEDAAIEDARTAVEELLAVCTAARDAGSTVYHWWAGGP